MKLLFAKLAPRGWWREHIDSAQNPQQILELLERDADWHPALPRIRTIVRGWKASRGRRDEYRCGRCQDVRWIVDERGEWRRCPGINGVCRQDDWVLARTRERTAEARSNAVSGEGASL